MLRAAISFLAVSVPLSVFQASAAEPWPEDVESALAQAGENRVELEKVLVHFQQSDDRQKFEAACFLIRNMPGHSYVTTGLFDGKKQEIPYDVLGYRSFGEARQALEALEEKHGELEFGRKADLPDLEAVRSDYLIENIEVAFRAWRTKPWSREMSFETFCEYILPYRASNEPAEQWRSVCELELEAVLSKMKNAADPREAAAAVQNLSPHRVYFRKLYYLHPTDQGFAQLNEKKLGRCEDQQTMKTYVRRANCIAVAGDYTPHWANRDNNHAWDVILDEEGRGSAGLSNRAAKVYRKMFSHNPENLYFHNDKSKEGIPRWLSGRSYRDVTDQYLPTTDLTVELEFGPSQPERFAYICVFNGGDWRPIHWARIAEGRATFTKMGRGIAYLACYFTDKKAIPAAPPFILDGDGKVRKLKASASDLSRVKIAGITPTIQDPDLKKELPAEEVQSGASYELFVWDRGWQSLGKHLADQKDPAIIPQLPRGGLYWIRNDKNRRTARIFTVEAGKQRMW